MYFSDEIFLISETRVKNEFNQYETRRKERGVWSDLGSISSKEQSNAGQIGHIAQAKAVVHIEDYELEHLVRIPDGTKVLRSGIYEVYRTFEHAGRVELYLKEKQE